MAALPLVVLLAGCVALSCVFSEIYSLWVDNEIRGSLRVGLCALGET